MLPNTCSCPTLFSSAAIITRSCLPLFTCRIISGRRMPVDDTVLTSMPYRCIDLILSSNRLHLSTLFCILESPENNFRLQYCFGWLSVMEKIVNRAPCFLVNTVARSNAVSPFTAGFTARRICLNIISSDEIHFI